MESESQNPSPTSPRRPFPAGSGPRRSARKRRKGSAWGVVALLVFAFVAVAGVVVYRKLVNIGGGGKQGGVTPGELIGLVNPDADRAQFPGKNRVNVLLIGKDYNRDSKGMPFTQIKGKSLGVRADSIMVLSLDFDSGRVSALSVPRDTRVTASDGQTGKINGTYARGGAPMLRDSVTKLLGVAPDYFIAVKPDAVKVMVDKLGGVNVEAIDAMNYDDNWGQLHVHLPAGKLTLTGDQAIGFARFREVKPGTPHSKEEGDPRRMARQQQLIRAMATKGKSVGNLFQLDDIADTALGQLETDMTRKQMLALVLFFRKIQPEDIQSASLEGKGTKGGVYFFLPDEKKKEAMVDWLLKGDETAADRLTVVAVENGTAVKGAAAKVAAKLREDGFDAQNAGAAHPEASAAAAPAAAAITGSATPGAAPIATTRILYVKASVAPRAQKIAQLLGVGAGQVSKEARPDTTGSFRRTAADRADVTIILGQDLAAAFGEQSAQL